MKVFINVICLIMLIAASIGFGGASLYVFIQVIEQIIIDGIDDIDEGLIGTMVLALCAVVVGMLIGIWAYYIGEAL